MVVGRAGTCGSVPSLFGTHPAGAYWVLGLLPVVLRTSHLLLQRLQIIYPLLVISVIVCKCSIRSNLTIFIFVS